MGLQGTQMLRQYVSNKVRGSRWTTFLKNEQGDGITYVLVLLAVAIFMFVLLIAFFPLLKTSIVGFFDSVLSYIGNLSSTVSSSPTVSS